MTNTMDQGDRGDIQLPSLFMDDFDWDTLLEDYGMDASYYLRRLENANGSGDNEALVWEPQGSTANDSMLSGADSQDGAKFPSYEYQPWEVVDPPRAPSDQTIIEALDFYVDDVSRSIAQGFGKTRPVEVSSSVTTTEKVDEAQRTVNVDAFALSLKVPSSTDSTPTKPRKRLHCDRVGCKVTFRRNYELERHQKNIHGGSSIYFCPVYGCNRSHKALPRFDKLQSHFRKHLNADRFCCLSQECTAGPFSRTELSDHLSVHGYPQHLEVSKDLLKALKWRLTPTGNHAFQLDNSDMCPLSFQGCTFKGNSFGRHLLNHELSDRSLGYLAISATLSYHSFQHGPWTCPLCKASSPGNESFLCHLESHSREEQFSNKSELVDMLSPWLSGLEPIYDGIERRIIDELRRGLNETERMRVKELTGQEPPV